MNFRYLFILFIAFFFSLTASSQQNKYYFSHEIESGIVEGSIRLSSASRHYLNIGDYQNGIRYNEQALGWGVDTAYYGEPTFIPALAYILEQAKNHRIVIISESHSKPQHRIFGEEIIVALADLGFTHLGLETFPHSPDMMNEMLDTAVHERGYLQNTLYSGTYTQEPAFAHLVRSALGKGYQLFSYEGRSTKEKDRDDFQAEHIIEYLRKHPDEKVVIFCGFYHAIEGDYRKRKNSYWMARNLKSELGIDPLTIYQDHFTEKVAENEHPLLRKYTKDEIGIALDPEGNIINWSDNVDIEVIHPKTRYMTGRAHWLYRNGKRSAVKIDHPEEGDYPFLVSAYYDGEEDGMPVDIIEIKSKYQPINLVLPKGSFTIVYDNKTVQTKKAILVE